MLDAHFLQLQQSRAPLELRLVGLVAPRHVGSFLTRDWTMSLALQGGLLSTGSLTTHWAVLLKPVTLLRPHSPMSSLTVIFRCSLFSRSLSLFPSSRGLCLPGSLCLAPPVGGGRVLTGLRSAWSGTGASLAVWTFLLAWRGSCFYYSANFFPVPAF